MAEPIRVPKDFRAIVFTAPARVDNKTLPQIQRYIKQRKLDKFEGHRIFHMHQVEDVDSAAIAELLRILQAAKEHGREFVICDPPPIVRSYLEIYGAGDIVKSRVLSSANDGTYKSVLLPFIPPFVPNENGRIDIYEDGSARSWEFAGRDLRQIEPVKLDGHPPKVPTRAHHMDIEDEPGHHAELEATGYVQVLRHNCGCGTTHSTFRKLHQLHQWYRNKGFDFRDVELWASDVPAGVVTEKLTFRDRSHFDQFQTLLKIDSTWKEIGAPMEHTEEEFYYVY